MEVGYASAAATAATMAAVLTAALADPDAPYVDTHTETPTQPLHTQARATPDVMAGAPVDDDDEDDDAGLAYSTLVR